MSSQAVQTALQCLVTIRSFRQIRPRRILDFRSGNPFGSGRPGSRGRTSVDGREARNTVAARRALNAPCTASALK